MNLPRILHHWSTFKLGILLKRPHKPQLQILLKCHRASVMNSKCYVCLSISSQHQPVAEARRDWWGVYLLLLSFLSPYSSSPDKMPWQHWPWYTLLMVWHHTQEHTLALGFVQKLLSGLLLFSTTKLSSACPSPFPGSRAFPSAFCGLTEFYLLVVCLFLADAAGKERIPKLP